MTRDSQGIDDPLLRQLSKVVELRPIHLKRKHGFYCEADEFILWKRTVKKLQKGPLKGHYSPRLGKDDFDKLSLAAPGKRVIYLFELEDIRHVLVIPEEKLGLQTIPPHPSYKDWWIHINPERGTLTYGGESGYRSEPIDYETFLNKYELIASTLRDWEPTEIGDSSPVLPIPLILTEGPTDQRHLQAALRWLKKRGQYEGMEVEFEPTEEIEEGKGEDRLKKDLRERSKAANPRPIIGMFDSDVNSDTIRDFGGGERTYRPLGSNVFSFIIPTPNHRSATPKISIEFYYSDDELRRRDRVGRRLFVHNEFNRTSLRNRYEPDLNCTLRSKIEKTTQEYLRLISENVFNSHHQDVALSKAAFSTYVLLEEPNFDNFDFSEFSKIFDIILVILKDASAQQQAVHLTAEENKV